MKKGDEMSEYAVDRRTGERGMYPLASDAPAVRCLCCGGRATHRGVGALGTMIVGCRVQVDRWLKDPRTAARAVSARQAFARVAA